MPVKEVHAERNAKIRELRDRMTLTQIAHHMGVSTNVVAGVFFRMDHPYQRSKRVRPVTDATLGKAARRAGLSLADIRALAQQRAAQ